MKILIVTLSSGWEPVGNRPTGKCLSTFNHDVRCLQRESKGCYDWPSYVQDLRTHQIPYIGSISSTGIRKCSGRAWSG